MRSTHCTFTFFVGAILLAPLFSYAAQLKMMSDTISTSAPGESAAHEILFTNTHPIPAGGEIRYRFKGLSSPFIFPDLFDYSYTGLSVSRGAGFEEYALDAMSDMATSSVALAPEGDGEIRVRIAYDGQFDIPAGSQIKLRIGGGALNTDSILNPNEEGSHRISLSTFDASDISIDRGDTMVATIKPIGLGANIVGTAAVLKNGLPKGLLPGGTKKVFVSLESNLPAYCRYSFTPNVTYDNMPIAQLFKSANFYRLHSFVLDVEDDHLYNIYVRCFTKYGLAVNEEDYPIQFEIGVVPKETRPPPPPPGTQSGNNTGGGNMLPQSGLTIEGRAFSGATVSILKDGKEFRTITADQQGSFSTLVSDLDRGTYGFTITAFDSEKLRSAPYSTTLYMSASSRNSIGPVYLSPTVTATTQRIDMGARALVKGRAVPLMTVQAVVVGPKDPLQQPYAIASTTANGSGEWSLYLDTSKLPKGTYAVRAQTLVPGQGNSQFSPEFLLGIGEKPQGNGAKRADINGDGKVNIADLSILLFSWRKSSQTADINMDGTVNITDFSIMLSAWTG